MSNRIKEVLISLGIVFTMFLVVGLILPSSRHLSAEMETNRKRTIVFDALNGFARWKDWNPIAQRSPTVQTKFSGPSTGKGARLDYMSLNNRDGVGSWTITDSVPLKSVSVDVDNSDKGYNKRMKFTLSSAGRMKRNTKVVQSYDVDYGFNLIGRYAGLYVSATVGEDLKSGMRKFNDMLALIPNFDYTDLETGDPATAPKFSQLGEKNIISVSVEVARAEEPLKNAIKDAQSTLVATMNANGLVADGPLQIVTTNFGQATYAFDVAQPVKKAGASGKIDIRTDNRVKAEYIPAGPAVQVAAVGTYNDLPKFRNALSQWAAAKGATPVGRAFESWFSGVEGSFLPTGNYTVYQRVKALPAGVSLDGAAKTEAAEGAAAPAAAEPAAEPAATP